MSGLWSFFHEVFARFEPDGRVQMDARLPDETPVHIMRSDEGYHIVVGDIIEDRAPSAVDNDGVLPEIIRQWRGGVG
jgi:hypothetical protein